jgi:uncharacterized protein YdeI (YjbR/CyaY-like superfamily)
VKLGKTFYAPDRATWRAWLKRHHQTAREIWLVYYKNGSGKPRIPYNHAVEEALCFGWIDSILKPIDGKKYAQRFSPRRATSVLSPMNRERVRRLIRAKRMTKAGLASLAHAFDHETESRADPPARIPQDILARLKRDPVVWKHFQRFSESYKRIRIGWITGARHRPDAFETRLAYFMKMTAKNKRFGMVQ